MVLCKALKKQCKGAKVVLMKLKSTSLNIPPSEELSLSLDTKIFELFELSTLSNISVFIQWGSF